MVGISVANGVTGLIEGGYVISNDDGFQLGAKVLTVGLRVLTIMDGVEVAVDDCGKVVCVVVVGDDVVVSDVGCDVGADVDGTVVIGDLVGFVDGFVVGFVDGFNVGFVDGFDVGFVDGFDVG